MNEFKFFLPVQVRSNDIDAWWHVNHSIYLHYLEQVRMEYLYQLGMFDGHSFHDMGLIMADMHISYRRPVVLFQKILIAARIGSIGNKSLKFHYQILDEETRKVHVEAESIGVGYDYRTQKTIPISKSWREKISAFEGIDFNM